LLEKESGSSMIVKFSTAFSVGLLADLIDGRKTEKKMPLLLGDS
jgi:hypothetical protein